MPDHTEATSVSSVRRLYERFRQLIHEGTKFGIVGLIGVFLNNLIDQALLPIGPIKAATVAVVVTTIISYLANRYWSFRHRERSTVPRETMLFFLLNGVGMVIQLAAVGFANYGLDQTSRQANFIANTVGILLATLFRFWSYRKWVWTAPQPAPQGHEELEPALASATWPARPDADEADGPS
jgi:putative flippase GtrA